MLILSKNLLFFLSAPFASSCSNSSTHFVNSVQKLFIFSSSTPLRPRVRCAVA